VTDNAKGPKKAAPSASPFTSADPPRNFSLSTSDRVRAAVMGAPAYATRKKSLEDAEERYVRVLVALHDALVAKLGAGADHAAVARALHEKAATFDLKKMNALVVSHNRWYPIEANLPVDLRTGEYLIYGKRWLPEEPWTVARLIACVHAEIAARSCASL
jgi:hypothetical protein